MPATSPDASSSSGTNSSSVVPGYVVDSSTTQAPGRRRAPRAPAAALTYDRSGDPSRSGVGTAMTATSNHAASDSSVVTVKRPELSASFTSPSVMSST